LKKKSAKHGPWHYHDARGIRSPKKKFIAKKNARQEILLRQSMEMQIELGEKAKHDSNL